MKPWIVDASPYLFLTKIDRLAVLRDPAPEVLIPRGVFQEILGHEDPAASKLQQAARSWLQVTEVEDRRAVEIILADLGPGEAEVIQLARERATTQVVLDDLDARRYARRVGLEPVGTLGLLLAARLRGEIHSLGAEIVRLPGLLRSKRAPPGAQEISTSVRLKSSPLKSKGSPLSLDNAYGKQSPKLRPARWRPLPNRR